MIIEAVLENQIIAALSDIEGAEDYQIIGSRTIPEDGDTKSEDNESIGVIAVSVGYRSNDNFSLPMLSIPATLQICTRTEEDATGVKHETFVASLASKLSFWHLHGDMMTAKFSSQKFLAGELTLNGGSGRKFDDSNKCWSENISFTIRGSERFTDDEYKYDIDWDKVNNPPSLNGVKITSNTTLGDIDVYSKEEADEKIDEVRSEIESISGLSSDVEEVKSEVSTINQFTKTNISALSSDVSTLSSTLISTQNELADVKRDGEELSEKVGTLSASVGNVKFDVAQIKAKMPTDATQSNKLASQAFVNSSINNFAAFYLTKNANGDAFGTYAELTSATKFYNAGVERTPTKNDYLVVLQDETKTTSLSVHPTTRYTYQGAYPDGQWEYQYTVNNTALTQSQVDAINSGITKNIVDTLVVPSDINSGWASNSDNAQEAQHSQTSELAYNAYQSDYADQAGYANEAGYAYQASNASLAETAKNAVNAATADAALTAQTADYATDAGHAQTANTALTANLALDISAIDASKITSGVINKARLPIASYMGLGIVKGVEKTSSMTEKVGIDSDGVMWYEKSSGGGSLPYRPAYVDVGGEVIGIRFYRAGTEGQDTIKSGKHIIDWSLYDSFVIPEYVLSFKLNGATNAYSKVMDGKNYISDFQWDSTWERVQYGSMENRRFYPVCDFSCIYFRGDDY